MAHHCNVASLNHLYRYNIGRCSSELSKLTPLTYSRGKSTRSYSFQDFSVTIPRCYKDVNVISFFPRTAKIWNILLPECFPLTYAVNGAKC